ncbi:MAG: hypothetical protein ACM3PY_02250 [Omnitrophica WOR_2 bacterium]
MKLRLVTLVTILAIAIAAAVPIPAFAQAPAYNTSFTTSITYQNVDTAATTTLNILFYPNETSTSPITIARPSLPAGAGTSLFIGSLSEIASGFHGSAVMESDKLLVATLVQLPLNSTTVKNRPLSNGFSAGAPQMLLATVLKNQFSESSQFSVQNSDGVPNDLDIKFYDTTAAMKHEIKINVQPGASYYVDAGQIAELGASFNGSVVVTAKHADGTPGNIVASVTELSTAGPTPALAFEGVASGANTFFMPSAICNGYPKASGNQNSAYAVQNSSLTASTSVTVKYSNGVQDTKPIGPGAKASFVACAAPSMPSGFTGSATISSTATPVIAIGKIYGQGLSTGFVGASTGAPKLALPYVRWSQTQYTTGARQRTFIAIQNVGGASIPAGSIKINYNDKNGNTLATHTIATAVATGAKVNSNPNQNAATAEFGYYPDNTFGGSAIVQCTAPSCQLVVIARVTSMLPDGSEVGEDYNGIVVP